jgi:hypothetical protein
MSDIREAVKAVEKVRDVLADAHFDCLGSVSIEGCQPWPIRDELIDQLTKAVSALQSVEGKDGAVQQAQIWAQEARTHKGIVEGIGALVGCSNDWEMVSAVQAALQSVEGERKAVMVPEGWKLVPIEPTPEMLARAVPAAVALVDQGPEQNEQTRAQAERYACQRRNEAAAYYRAMLAAAPSDAKSEAEIRAEAILEAVDYAKENSPVNRGVGSLSQSKVLEYAFSLLGGNDGAFYTRDELEARLRQTDSEDDSNE